jgi:hypothetical protein
MGSSIVNLDILKGVIFTSLFFVKDPGLGQPGGCQVIGLLQARVLGAPPEQQDIAAEFSV